MDHLSILSQTIADHARKTAHQEWNAEHACLWGQIVSNAGLTGSTLEVDGRSIPIEVITKALREQFLKHRMAQLLPQLTHSIVETAFKKILTDEGDTP
jgi:hypothetical protein